MGMIKSKGVIKIVIVFLQGFLLSLALMIFGMKGFALFFSVVGVLLIASHLNEQYFFPKIFGEKLTKFDALEEAERLNRVEKKHGRKKQD